MLSKKQNLIETLKKDGHPDRLVNNYEYGAFMPGDPIEFMIRGEYHEGMEDKQDAFGTWLMWPKGYVAIMPHVTDDNKVIKDIEEWEKYLKVPEIAKNLDNPKAWEVFNQRAAAVPRDELFLMPFMHTGLFERTHFVLGMEDLFISLYEYPDELEALITRLAEYRFEVFKTLINNVHPDLILSHDDWGSKTQLFMQPDLWRKFYKPHYEKLYGYCHEQGIIVVHHADSYCEDIIEDMVDCHIDIWQGVLPTNNIEKIIKQLDGRMTIQGGLESGIIDSEDATEESVRKHVREVCEKYGPMGHFIPSITMGGPGTLHPQNYLWIVDEIDRYNKETYGVCSEPLDPSKIVY